MLKFSIGQILVVTLAVALVLAIVRSISPATALIMLWSILGIAHLFVLTLPPAVVFTTIALAREQDGYLRLSSNPLLKTCAWLWTLSLAIVVGGWCFGFSLLYFFV